MGLLRQDGCARAPRFSDMCGTRETLSLEQGGRAPDTCEKTMATKYKKPKAERDVDRKIRKCMMCQRPFPSEWAGERICRKCKSTAAWRGA